MAASVLDFIPRVGNYRFSTNLNNVEYTFDVRWNSRDKAWRFDMYDNDGYLMVAGVKIVIDAYLGRRSTHPFFNQNVLVAIDLANSGVEPTYDDMGVRVEFRHYPLSDLVDFLFIR